MALAVRNPSVNLSFGWRGLKLGICERLVSGFEVIMQMVDLLAPELDTLGIEVTSKCNLRCAYCAKADDIYESIASNNGDMTDEMIGELYLFCKKEGIINISLSGVGETALTAGWHKRLSIFLDDPELKNHLVSNFARILSDDDIDALIKLNNIQISFDSANIHTVRKMRSKADLRTITFNIVRLLKRRRELGRGPHVLVNCTLCRANIGDIAELASFCAELGVDRLMINEVMTLTKTNKNMPDTLEELSNDEVALLAEQVYKAETLLRESNTGLVLGNRLRLRVSDLVEQLYEGRELNNPSDYFHRRLNSAGCRQPWSQPFVRTDGNVYPCCIAIDTRQAIGNLAEEPLSRILDNSKMRSFREKLLSDAGEAICGKCTLAQESTWEEFALDIRRWKGDATAELQVAPQVTQSIWPALEPYSKGDVTLENLEFTDNSGAVVLKESKNYGLHRVLADVDLSGSRSTISFEVIPAGRRRFRFDLTTRSGAMLGRFIIVLTSRPTVEIILGDSRCRVSRHNGNVYSVEIGLEISERLGGFNITLVRDDNSVVYSGDGRSSLIVSKFGMNESDGEIRKLSISNYA